MTSDVMPFAGWGDPARRHGLPPHALPWLERTLGVTAADAVAVVPPAAPPPSRLAPAALDALRACAHVDTTDDARIARAGGKSYLDLLRHRAGDTSLAPDAVVLPSSADEVAAVLAVCTEHRVAVVPFGGGTSVVGGVSAAGLHAVVALDLGRMDRLVDVDEESLLATFEPGVRGPDAEKLLAPYGLELGHLPQSWEFATIGGFVATRSAGQASTGYGRSDEMVVALTVVTPAGTINAGRGAKSAAGPDLKALLVGSEGAFGVVTSVTLRVRRRSDERHYAAYLTKGFEAGRAILRSLEQAGVAPDVARLSDPDETQVQLTLSGAGKATRAYVRARGGRDACLLILGWEGRTAERRKAAEPLLRKAVGLGTKPGEQWRHGRFDAPYLRDDLMDAGVLVETLETSGLWSDLDRIHADVRAALTRSLGTCVVMCHVSHLYPQGASLYFTVLAKARGAQQWVDAKTAATDAIVRAGGTITHHHAVGRDHAPWLAAEVGDLGVAVLRAVKATLDPAGICNPGVLVGQDPLP